MGKFRYFGFDKRALIILSRHFVVHSRKPTYQPLLGFGSKLQEPC